MLPVPNPKVLFKSMSDGAVLFSTDNEVYFGLNSVGARVWELLPPVCSTLEELVTRLAGEYPDVSRQIIEKDVTELLAELTSHKLVAVRAEGQSDQSGETRVSAKAGKA